MAATKLKHRRTSRPPVLSGRGLADKVALVEKSVTRAEMQEWSAGDTVRVHVRIKEGDKERIQPYEGVVIARSGRGANRSFVVRKISHGVGVERIFMETSPKVAKVELVQRGRVRRGKLYYLRGLEGKAAKVARAVETQAQAAASAAAKGQKAST
jgi:large subunit ribosomal protein L19